MQKVIIINLNGHAYHVEEAGYDTLREYLTRAERDLAGNPDLAEIMRDLEQAIADKCQKFLGPHKSVVTATEVDQIVAEMGPVDPTPGDRSHTHAGSEGRHDAGGAAPPKRLHRIPDGAMIGGVCTGIAAYFSVDVAIVRVLFVLAALLTQGLGILVYVAMMFIVPEANTPEERAAAGSIPFNARVIVDRAKTEYAKGARRMRGHWRLHWRKWRARTAAQPPLVYGPPPAAALMVPVLGLVHIALFVTLAAMVISLVNTGDIMGWEPPPDVPVWASLLILLVLYQIVVSPIRMAGVWAAGQSGAFAFWNAVTWLVALAFVVWMAANNIHEIQEFLRRVPDVARDFSYAMRDFLTR